jgi:hypothetical protein
VAHESNSFQGGIREDRRESVACDKENLFFVEWTLTTKQRNAELELVRVWVDFLRLVRKMSRDCRDGIAVKVCCTGDLFIKFLFCPS